MIAYVTIPKNLTKMKSKMLFGLTKRQLVCFGSAALVGVPRITENTAAKGAKQSAAVHSLRTP